MDVEVGILSAPSIRYQLLPATPGDNTSFPVIEVDKDNLPAAPIRGPFRLLDVVIGDNFHWQRKMDQCFGGLLKFIREGDNVTAVNIIDVEEYLLSVISSEMKATADLEFLKAHAVISRSWLLAQIRSRRPGCTAGSPAPGEEKNGASGCKTTVPAPGEEKNGASGCKTTVPAPGDRCSEASEGGEYIRWFDHEDHAHFDVCADDHCQRYQGMQMAVGETVRQAIEQTRSQVLTYKGEICDARFSKCCGGRTERFSACWEDRDYDYLTPVEDPWCDTDDEKILSRVLNDYDLETRDFHDWTVRYTREELSELVRRRSGIDFGTIEDLIPLERGESGRIIRLKIVGDKRTLVVGKELIIRRFLSESHLKSSAFELARQGTDFVLTGRGWGHGVGLCQIGAAVMAAHGIGYREILAHYYPGAEVMVTEEQDR